MTRAKRSRHRRRETEPLLRNLQVGRLDLVADAISSSGHRSQDSSFPVPTNGIENGVASEREELDESLSEALRIGSRMTAPCRFAFDVGPCRSQP